jgi:hypothetical protein
VFNEALAAELSILHRERGALEFAWAEIEPEHHGLAAEELTRRSGRRLGVCRREPTKLAIFKRDSHAVVATTTMANTLSSLNSANVLRAAGWVSIVDNGLPLIPSSLVLQLAGRALDHARSHPRSPPRRVVITLGAPSPIDGATMNAVA